MTNPNALVAQFTYDALQRITSIQAGAETTRYIYDTVGRLNVIKGRAIMMDVKTLMDPCSSNGYGGV